VNSQEAKQILLLYRPGAGDADDLQMVQALDLTRQDPELGQWFEQHCAFQRAMRAKFQDIVPPPHLKAAILAQQKIIHPPIWWQEPVWLAAAAVVALFLGLAGFWLWPHAPNRFANFQARMVSTALRQYPMDIVTNDMLQVRQWMAARGAPADYDLTKGLERLKLTGGGLLRWRNNPVTMVCFDRGDTQMLFLFVMNRAAIKDPPPASPQLAKVNDLQAASWTQGDKTYVLAGPEESDFARKYLPPKS
jgi:hypothetical protein